MEDKELEVKDAFEEQKNEAQEKRALTLFYINMIIVAAVSAFFLLGTVFRIASLHFVTIYDTTQHAYNYVFYNMSGVFIALCVLSAIGLGVFNFVMIFVNSLPKYKKRSAINVIIALVVITLLVFVTNLL